MAFLSTCHLNVLFGMATLLNLVEILKTNEWVLRDLKHPSRLINNLLTIKLTFFRIYCKERRSGEGAAGRESGWERGPRPIEIKSD